MRPAPRQGSQHAQEVLSTHTRPQAPAGALSRLSGTLSQKPPRSPEARLPGPRPDSSTPLAVGRCLIAHLDPEFLHKLLSPTGTANAECGRSSTAQLLNQCVGLPGKRGFENLAGTTDCAHTAPSTGRTAYVKEGPWALERRACIQIPTLSLTQLRDFIQVPFQQNPLRPRF